MLKALKPSIFKKDNVICFIAVLATWSPLCAEPATTTWTAYLYQGPGTHYAVVDELPQAAHIDVDRCDGDWCRITSGDRIGYLRAEIVMRSNLAGADPAHPPAGVLAQPAAALSPTSPKGPCVQANQTGGNGGNAMTVFCQR